MARSKKKSEAAPQEVIAADPATYTPTLSSDSAEQTKEVVADAAVAPATEYIEVAPNMDIVNRALAEASKIANVVGKEIDIATVVAKHLESTAAGTPGSSKVAVSRSSVLRPVKLVHVIASEMHEKNPEIQRKDVIAACEAAGIATHTARTQYQIWHQAMKSDRATKAAQELAATTQHRTPLAVQRGTVPNNTSARKPRK